MTASAPDVGPTRRSSRRRTTPPPPRHRPWPRPHRRREGPPADVPQGVAGVVVAPRRDVTERRRRAPAAPARRDARRHVVDTGINDQRRSETFPPASAQHAEGETRLDARGAVLVYAAPAIR